jgi:hypothetical protein
MCHAKRDKCQPILSKKSINETLCESTNPVLVTADKELTPMSKVLYHIVIVALQGCVIVALHGCVIVALHGCLIVVMQGCVIVVLQDCVIVVLQGCVIMCCKVA